eukprot:3003077-Karenia_brevis.AAC.1
MGLLLHEANQRMHQRTLARIGGAAFDGQRVCPDLFQRWTSSAAKGFTSQAKSILRAFFCG